MSATIACIGSGNMGFALMKGAAASGCGANIGFADSEEGKARAAAAALGAAAYRSNAEAAEKGDYVFLAVKPQALAAVLGEIAPEMRKRLKAGKAPVLVSMAAGWPIARIQASLRVSLRASLRGAPRRGGAQVPVARIMPNTPALVSQGMIALAASPELDGGRAAELEALLKGAGTVDRVDEGCLDAVTGLSGSGPAFACLFIEALADGGVLAGLPRDKALRYAAQTVRGAAAMVLETGRHPGELKDMVCSPGGTTIAGVAVLESGAFRAAAMQAVEAAWRRAVELGGIS